jgi:hypothetical protein
MMNDRIQLQRRAIIQEGLSCVVLQSATCQIDRFSKSTFFEIGELAKFMLAGGVSVKSRLNEIPWAPVVIHGRHHLQALAAMTRFDAAPAIYHCHGLGPWVEKPPFGIVMPTADQGDTILVMDGSMILRRLDAERQSVADGDSTLEKTPYVVRAVGSRTGWNGIVYSRFSPSETERIVPGEIEYLPV